MTTIKETAISVLDATRPEAESRSSFITPEMVEKNPVLGVAGAFAGDPLFDELVKEIKKERERQKRRDRRQATK